MILRERFEMHVSETEISIPGCGVESRSPGIGSSGIRSFLFVFLDL
jgi:hypothetical protein